VRENREDTSPDVSPAPPAPVGMYDGKYLAFLEAVQGIRARLHRYCARMTGSAVDGEDIAQEALFLAFRAIDQHDAGRPWEPWLLGIAHNRCVDFLRRRGLERDWSNREVDDADDRVEWPNESALDVPVALERVVLGLPPKERACFLLKDVLSLPHAQIADIVASTVGGVKAALHRARTKVAALPASSPERQTLPTDAELRILRLYVELFNAQDWDGIVALTRSDARLEVVDRFAGPLNRQAPYFANAEKVASKFRFGLGSVDGQVVVVRLQHLEDQPSPHSVVRITIEGARITAVRDFVHCPWLLPASAEVLVGDGAWGEQDTRN
jgi:RNA polymerase sigma-70 factor, ECF subfamily